MKSPNLRRLINIRGKVSDLCCVIRRFSPMKGKLNTGEKKVEGVFNRVEE